MELELKNGFKVHIPKGATFADWHHTKMLVDVLIGTPSRGQGVRFFPDKRGRPLGWRQSKKLIPK